MATIGQLAKALDISVETIRFYQRKGLIAEPQKPATGYRHYDDRVADQLRFILNAKSLGFTLNEIGSLMSLSNNCSEVKSMSLQKLELIQAKIANLQKLENVIQQMTESCKRNQNPGECPVINALK